MRENGVCAMFLILSSGPNLGDPDFPFLFSWAPVVVIFRRTEKIVVWGTLVGEGGGGGGGDPIRTDERKTNSFLPPPPSLPLFPFPGYIFVSFFTGEGMMERLLCFPVLHFLFFVCSVVHPARALSNCQRGGFPFSVLKKLNF